MNLRRIALAVLTASTVGFVGACGASEAADGDAVASTSTSTSTSTTTTSTSTTTTTTAPPPPTLAAEPAVAATAPPPPPATEAPPLPPLPPYHSSVAVIDDAARARMPHSWRPECPVPLENLRLVTVSHWNDAGQVARGEIVVHADHADAIAGVFGELFAMRFPITRMQMIDDFGGDDGASMRANNTSGFNCRPVAGTGTWSEHAKGLAIDINPLVNPWVRGNAVDPPEGRPYVDRRNQVPGGIYAGDGVVQAFAAIGWQWGGAWSSLKDYQHFSATGR